MTFTEKTDALTVACEKLSALTWLFSENYTACLPQNVADAVRANPTAFVATFSVIEDMIATVGGIASDLASMAYEHERQAETVER